MILGNSLEFPAAVKEVFTQTRYARNKTYAAGSRGGRQFRRYACDVVQQPREVDDPQGHELALLPCMCACAKCISIRTTRDPASEIQKQTVSCANPGMQRASRNLAALPVGASRQDLFPRGCPSRSDGSIFIAVFCPPLEAACCLIS